MMLCRAFLPGRHGTARVRHTICYGYFLVHTSVSIYQFRTSYEKLSRLKSDWSIRNLIDQSEIWLINQKSDCSIRNLIDQSDFWVTNQISEWPIIFSAMNQPRACSVSVRLRRRINNNNHVALVVNRQQWRLLVVWRRPPGFLLPLTRPASSKRSNNINRLKTYYNEHYILINLTL